MQAARAAYLNARLGTRALAPTLRARREKERTEKREEALPPSENLTSATGVLNIGSAFQMLIRWRDNCFGDLHRRPGLGGSNIYADPRTFAAGPTPGDGAVLNCPRDALVLN
jgi:hypothetical protein